MSVAKDPKKAIIPLLLVIAIDSMNFGFIFPVLTPLLLQGSTPILSPETSQAVRDLLYGLVVATFPVFMFIGAPILGDLSDYVGRKRVLLICLLGTGFGYLVSGIGISTNLFSLLIIGRIISGITAGSLPMAQAAIADVSKDSKNQAKYMGMMMFAIAAGQVLGPAFAGFFSDVHISSLFSNALPFYLATVLTGINIIWLLAAFRETYVIHQFKKVSFIKTFRSYKEVFLSKPIFLMSLVFLCMQLSWSFYSQATPAYLQAIFHYSNFSLGVFSASLGVFIAVGGTLIMPSLANHVTTKQGATIALLAMALGVFIGIILDSQILFWVGVAINASAAALAFSFIITLFSSLVDKSRQGWVMGITGAIIAVAWGITALLTGFLIIYSKVLAAYLAVILSLIGALFSSRSKTLSNGSKSSKS